MLFHSSTGMPVVDAQEDFLRARRAHVAARLVRRARVPRTLPGPPGVPRGQARAQVLSALGGAGAAAGALLALDITGNESLAGQPLAMVVLAG
jgi:hypothetical protein